jgi:hypothetical protein
MSILMITKPHKSLLTPSTSSSSTPVSVPAPASQPQSSQPLPLKRFKYLAQQLPIATTSTSVSPANTAVEELGDYISNLPCFLFVWLLKGPSTQEVSRANTLCGCSLTSYPGRNLPCDIDDGIQWWLERDGPKKQRPSWAVDILSASSSEAFMERVFSACRDFTTGKRNRTLESLER